MRQILLSLVAILVMGNWATAQGPVSPRFRWTTGQVLLYRLDHTTEATDNSADSKSETRSSLRVVKRWDVTAVDEAGVATLQMSLVSMMQERTTPSGEVLKYDSAAPDKSTPQLKEAMAKFLNTPLAVIRVDTSGRVVEVKESRGGMGSFENELPFLVVMPAAAIKAGDTWDRDYKITLPPPLGTGEKTDSVQKYTCKTATADQVTIALTTQLKTAPKVEVDVIPLWQMMPEGELIFDLKQGRLHSAKLVIQKEIKGHQGENSSASFKSTMTITYAGER
ncbi:MAG: hypothetical protein U0840_06480 [Gemmataceae bacterium]